MSDLNIALLHKEICFNVFQEELTAAFSATVFGQHLLADIVNHL